MHVTRSKINYPPATLKIGSKEDEKLKINFMWPKEKGLVYTDCKFDHMYLNACIIVINAISGTNTP